MEKEITKGVVLKYAEGKLSIEAEVKELITAELDKVVAKFEAGEIDLVKGTDLDKSLALMIIEQIKKAL